MMNHRPFALVSTLMAAGLAAAAMACSSSSTSSTPPDAAGAEPQDSAADGTGPNASDGSGLPDGPVLVDGAACSGPAYAAQSIAATCEPTGDQTPVGGPIAGGTYDTTAVVVFGSAPCSSPWAPGATVDVAGSLLRVTFAAAPGIGQEQQEWSFSVSGPQLTLTLLCDTDPNGHVGTVATYGYTATSTTLTLYVPGDSAAGFLAENVTLTHP